MGTISKTIKIIRILKVNFVWYFKVHKGIFWCVIYFDFIGLMPTLVEKWTVRSKCLLLCNIGNNFTWDFEVHIRIIHYTVYNLLIF